MPRRSKQLSQHRSNQTAPGVSGAVQCSNRAAIMGPELAEPAIVAKRLSLSNLAGDPALADAAGGRLKAATRETQ